MTRKATLEVTYEGSLSLLAWIEAGTNEGLLVEITKDQKEED